MTMTVAMAVGAASAFATPDWSSWDDGYARSFSADDIRLEAYVDKYYRFPVLLVANGAEGGPLLACAPYDDYDIPHCPFTSEGHEFTGWKMFDACVRPGAGSGTATSCVLPSGETYDWSDDGHAFGYVGERLPGETIREPCGIMVLVAQWRETPESPKYRLTVLVDPDSKGGSVSGSSTYAPGATVTLKATPKKGYYFSEWEVLGTTDTSVDNKYDIVSMRQDRFRIQRQRSRCRTDSPGSRRISSRRTRIG